MHILGWPKIIVDTISVGFEYSLYKWKNVDVSIKMKMWEIVSSSYIARKYWSIIFLNSEYS